MIYIAGDIHGELEVGKVVHFINAEARKRTLTEEDYLILLGDAGLCWDGGKKDALVRKLLEELPVTILWLDGNHENFDLIDALPKEEWHGGKVQFLGKKMIHLMRGYVYEICGKKFFVFGGGFSIDRMWRVEGISWWSRELPSEEEYKRGREQLEAVGNKVDYILTHTAPFRIAYRLVKRMYSGEEELQRYLQEVADNTEFQKWYFGHWHIDRVIENYVGLYDEIVCLDNKKVENGTWEETKI